MGRRHHYGIDIHEEDVRRTDFETEIGILGHSRHFGLGISLHSSHLPGSREFGFTAA